MTTSTQERLTGLTLDQRWHVLNFDLRLSSDYHTERRRFFDRLHNWTTAVSAILGSATVVALLDGSGLGRQIALGCSLPVAIASILDTTIGFAGKAAKHSDLARRFIELERKFILAQPDETTYAQLLAGRREIEAEEPPALPALVVRCHRELARRDGHKEGDPGMPAPLGFMRRHFAHVLPLR